MISKKDLKKFIEWLHENHDVWEDEDFVSEQFFNVAGDDKSELFNALDTLDAENLNALSGLFDSIYDKWPDKETQQYLEKKIKFLEDNGYSYTY